MRRLAPKFSRILAMGLALSASAWAAPSSSRLPTPAEPVQTDIDGEPAAAQMKCVRGADGVSTCAAQHESFERAAQTASYLGIYLSQYSDFARKLSTPGAAPGIQKAVLHCLQNSSCSVNDQKILTAAIIQYNLGKEVRAMMLKNNTNQANMESFKVPAERRDLLHGKQRNVLRAARTYKETFKLQPKDFSTVESFRRGAKADGERQSLGEEFRQDYLKFIDTYTETTQDKGYWHRASTNPAGSATAHSVWDIDPNTHAPKMHNDQFAFDLAAQGNDKVRKIVRDARDTIRAPEVKAIKDKPGQATISGAAEALQFDRFALGVPKEANIKVGDKVYHTRDEGKIARGIANEINERIAKRETEDKKNKGVGFVNVQLGVEQMDAYLDKIWPQTGYKYKIPSQEK